MPKNFQSAQQAKPVEQQAVETTVAEKTVETTSDVVVTGESTVSETVTQSAAETTQQETSAIETPPPPVASAPVVKQSIVAVAAAVNTDNDKYFDGLNAVTKPLVLQLINYAKAMHPRTPVDLKTIVNNQVSLARVLVSMVNDVTVSNGYSEMMKAAFKVWTDNENTAFSELYVMREINNMPLSKDHIQAFAGLVTVFRVASNPQTRQRLGDLCDLTKLQGRYVSSVAIERLRNLLNT